MRQVLTARNITGEASAEIRLAIRPDPKKILAGKQRTLAKRMADQKDPLPPPPPPPHLSAALQERRFREGYLESQPQYRMSRYMYDKHQAAAEVVQLSRPAPCPDMSDGAGTGTGRGGEVACP